MQSDKEDNMHTEWLGGSRQTSTWAWGKCLTDDSTLKSGPYGIARNLPERHSRKKEQGDRGHKNIISMPSLRSKPKMFLTNPRDSPSSYHYISQLPILAKLSKRANFLLCPHNPASYLNFTQTPQWLTDVTRTPYPNNPPLLLLAYFVSQQPLGMVRHSSHQSWLSAPPLRPLPCQLLLAHPSRTINIRWCSVLNLFFLLPRESHSFPWF